MYVKETQLVTLYFPKEAHLLRNFEEDKDCAWFLYSIRHLVRSVRVKTDQSRTGGLGRMIIIDADVPKNCRLCFIVRGKCPVYKNQHFMNGKVIMSKPLQEGCLIKGVLAEQEVEDGNDD